MIKKIYIQTGKDQQRAEHTAIKDGVEARGIDYELFTKEDLANDKLVFDKHTAVAGNLSVLASVFQAIGFEQHQTCYPPSLQPMLKREIWESTLGELLEKSTGEEVSNIFIKPKSDIALFTGFVVNDNDDLELIDDLPPTTALYCSSVVQWYGEFRVYVCRGNIIGVEGYRGDPKASLNMPEVEAAIYELEQSGEATAGYGVDFGVLLNGQTALVEWNDGLALGKLGLSSKVYTDLFLARWEEVLQDAANLK